MELDKMIKSSVFTSVKTFAVSVSCFEDDGQTLFCPSIILFVYQDSKDVVHELPMMLEIIADSFSEAVYRAYEVGSQFTGEYYDPVTLFDIDEDEDIAEASMTEIIDSVHVQLVADVGVPEGTVIH